MKLISWNVNGIRAALQKDFVKSVEKMKPDILCLQETKAHPDQVDAMLADFEHHYWNAAEKKGYSGTAVFSKIQPLSVTYGMNKEEHDKEGRLITLEFEEFYLINCYTPNAQRGLTRLAYRQEWDVDFRNYVKSLEKNKPVIFCGDLNVAHKEIDIKNAKANRKNAGFTDEEREGMTKHLDAGYLDSFREFNDKPDQYSWWSYRFNARARNIGWRIDYFIVSEKLKKRLKKAFILQDVMGSDHCPVGIELTK